MRQRATHSFAAENSGRGVEVEGLVGISLGNFRIGVGAIGSLRAKFKKSRRISSVESGLLEAGGIETSSATSDSALSVAIFSSVANRIGRLSSAWLGRGGTGESAFLFLSRAWYR